MKKLILPLLLLMGACSNPSQSYFEKVKAEHPTGRIFSETPLQNGREWVVREGDATYNVEFDDNGIPRSTLLVERWNPSWDTLAPKKDSIAAPTVDSIKKFNDTTKH